LKKHSSGNLDEEKVLTEFLTKFTLVSSSKFKILDLKEAFYALPKKFNEENLYRSDLYNLVST